MLTYHAKDFRYVRRNPIGFGAGIVGSMKEPRALRKSMMDAALCKTERLKWLHPRDVTECGLKRALLVLPQTLRQHFPLAGRDVKV